MTQFTITVTIPDGETDPMTMAAEARELTLEAVGTAAPLDDYRKAIVGLTYVRGVASVQREISLPFLIQLLAEAKVPEEPTQSRGPLVYEEILPQT